MTTRIERAEANLKKMKDESDIKKLENVLHRIGGASVVLHLHNFQPHRKETIEHIAGLINNICTYIEKAQADNPASVQPTLTDTPENK